MGVLAVVRLVIRPTFAAEGSTDFRNIGGDDMSDSYPPKFLTGTVNTRVKPSSNAYYSHNCTSVRLRYVYNIEWFRPGGVVFLVPGEQRALDEEALERVGFLWDVAPLLDAAVVVAEQRFYGQSQPTPLSRMAKQTGGVWVWPQLRPLRTYDIINDYYSLAEQFIREVLGNATVSQLVIVGVGYSGVYANWMGIVPPITGVTHRR
jgi:Serine carboxypeptidase S28